MHRTRATKGHERKIAWVVASVSERDANRAFHGGIRDGNHAGGSLRHVETEGTCDMLPNRLLRQAGIQGQASRESEPTR
jgi:hypothetical protein